MRATWITRRRAGRLGIAVALLVGSLAVLVRSADAHHPEITVSATCGANGPVVRWTAVAWQTSQTDSRINHDVRVQALVSGEWQEIARADFSAADNFQFGGTYDLPPSISDTLYLKVLSIPRWGSAENLGGVNQFRQTNVTIPPNCAGGGSGTTCGGSLGIAADYNLFVRGNVTLANSGIGGRVAAGGDVSLTSFGVGSDISASSARVDLAADGALTVSNTHVSSGSVTYGTSLTGSVSTPQGVVTRARAAYVANTFADLYTGAADWAAVAPNGTMAFTGTAPRTLTLTGTDPTLNVWTLQATDLQRAQQIRVNAPNASTMLVNVTGAAYSTDQAGLASMAFWNGTGYAQYGYPSSEPIAVAYRTHLLWNFPDAASVQIGPGLAWEGTVLAPYATVALTGGAALNGGVIAASATMGTGAISTELHPYSANPPCLPPGGVPTTPTTTSNGGTTTTAPPTGPTTLPAAPTTISPYCIAYGNLSGTVFEDHDANGRLDAGGNGSAADRGVGNVTVRAYDSIGNAVGVATSAVDGTWKMNIVSSASRDLRVEFSGLPAGYRPGSLTTTGGAVQFVGMCDEGIDLAVQIPAHYCQDNPDLAVSCQRKAASVSPVIMSQKWLSGWDASVADTAPNPSAEYATGFRDASGGTAGHPVATRADEIGAVSGLAWRPATRTLYADAYLKSGSPLGPGGPSAVYAVPVAADGSGTASRLAFKLPAAAGGAPALDASGAPANFDDATHYGLGGMTLVPDLTDPSGDALYVVGLASRRLYRVTDLDAASPTVTPIDAPLDLPGAARGCAAVDVVPFALTTWNDTVYLGLTCSAQSTQDASGVRAYVYAYVGGAWSTAPVLEIPLDYQRGELNYWGGAHSPDNHWRPWTSDPAAYSNQAVLTDLTFTEGAGAAAGDLVVGLRTRTGDRVIDEMSSGDMLLATRVGSAWSVQPTLSPTSANEYFFNDGMPFSAVQGTGARAHFETSRGAVVAVPGFPTVASTALTNYWTHGITWHDLSTGHISRALSLYQNDTPNLTDTFGKTNSLGDLVALCDQAPIEIGDRVWVDVDDDGVQDVGEFGLANVKVELRAANGTVVATTTTDGLGQYTFRGVTPRTAYEVWVDLGQLALQPGYRPSPVGQGGNAELDNDAARSDNAVMLSLTTGNPGDNAHSYDVGLVGPPPPRPTCACATTTTTLPEAADPPPSKPTYVSP